MGTKPYKVHLKESYRDIPPRSFALFDYVLCFFAYLLLAVAWIPALAQWLLGR